MTDRDQTDEADEADEPTPPWLHAALAAPVDVDPGVRDAHVRAAMRVFTDAAFEEPVLEERAIAPVVDLTRRRRRARWLAAAAAVVLTIGVAGWWVRDPGTTNSTDRLARSSASESVDTTTAPQAESAPGMAADSSADAAPPGSDVGEFSSDVALRELVRTLPDGGAAAAGSPSTRAGSDDQPSRDLPAAAAPTCPMPPGMDAATAEHHTATVAGAPVDVWLDGRGDVAVIVVLDRASCTIRSG